MLTIRREQLDLIRDERRTDYHRRLVKYFRRNTPELVADLDDSQLEQHIAADVEKARGYGAHSGIAILKFVTMSLVAGPHFDSDPEINSYLTDPRYDSEQKIEKLAQSLAEAMKHHG
jgi:hypothetical protein